MLDPTVMICDEPVSALDVSVQAQILNLLDDLKRDRGLTMVFIAHDLAVVKNVSDRVAVMYLGKLCEVAPPDTLYHAPEHPYTEALLTSIPEPDPSTAIDAAAPLSGDLPSPINPPSGCRFRTRCPFAQQRCVDEEPQMRAVGPNHFVACHFPLSTNPTPHEVGTVLGQWTAAPTAAPEPPPPPSPTPAPDTAPASWSVQAPDGFTAPAPPPPPASPAPAPAPWAPPPPPSQTPPAPSSPPEHPPPERPPLWLDPSS
jgi:oligopeptide/dipeptide ABC transporter ATP-binding protein